MDQFAAMLHSAALDAASDLYRSIYDITNSHPNISYSVAIRDMAIMLVTDANRHDQPYLDPGTEFPATEALYDDWKEFHGNHKDQDATR